MPIFYSDQGHRKGQLEVDFCGIWYSNKVHSQAFNEGRVPRGVLLLRETD